MKWLYARVMWLGLMRNSTFGPLFIVPKNAVEGGIVNHMRHQFWRLLTHVKASWAQQRPLPCQRAPVLAPSCFLSKGCFGVFFELFTCLDFFVRRSERDFLSYFSTRCDVSASPDGMWFGGCLGMVILVQPNCSLSNFHVLLSFIDFKKWESDYILSAYPPTH